VGVLLHHPGMRYLRALSTNAVRESCEHVHEREN
jgi:hypothetical protein